MRTPGGRAERVLPLILFGVAAAALYLGWRSFWFLTDDAYIAFRYVSNSQLGLGYVWNAAPFLPVEGYTSFLWVAILDGVWSLTGVEPPESSNWLALGFGMGSLLLAARMAWTLELRSGLARLRPWLLFTVLLSVVTNPSFLMWTSSGLETALFNFCLLAWVWACVFLPSATSGEISGRWLMGVTGTASLAALTRPDGMLLIASSLALIGLKWLLAGPASSSASSPGSTARVTRPPISRVFFTFPLTLPLAHILWRKSFYGEWLPNTYYAKVVAAWPESGLRYFASFVLEYGLWLWGALLIWLLLAGLRDRGVFASWRLPQPAEVPLLAVAGTLVAHVGYYTLIVGGDHFEYRVYSYTAVLIPLTAVWLCDRLVVHRQLTVSLAAAIPLAVVLVSWPIPWTLWADSRQLDPAKTRDYHFPVARVAPPWLAWYAGWYDDLQSWLILDHAVGKRWAEHAVFHRRQLERYPRERQLSAQASEQNWVHTVGSVGVPGWILADVHLIDMKGLNDYVVARTPAPSGERLMAHERAASNDYVSCFRPNVFIKKAKLIVRNRTLSASQVRACETHHRGRLAEERRPTRVKRSEREKR